jgi:hypothetical protein
MLHRNNTARILLIYLNKSRIQRNNTASSVAPKQQARQGHDQRIQSVPRQALRCAERRSQDAEPVQKPVKFTFSVFPSASDDDQQQTDI